MGKSRGYIGDALGGRKKLMIELVVEILDYLGIDPDDFFAV